MTLETLMEGTQNLNGLLMALGFSAVAIGTFVLLVYYAVKHYEPEKEATFAPYLEYMKMEKEE